MTADNNERQNNKPLTMDISNSPEADRLLVLPYVEYPHTPKAWYDGFAKFGA